MPSPPSLFEPSFPCTRCGACCRSVHASPLTAWLADETGACRHLDRRTELCTIYDTRPDICRVDVQYQRNDQQHLSWRQFCDLNVQCCEALQAQQAQQQHPPPSPPAMPSPSDAPDPR